jgi:hypothetical protein
LHSSDEEKDEVDLDPEGDLVKLLEGISESSSESDEPRSENVIATRRKTTRQREAANLMANVAVLIISCWILRVPVIYMDFVRCAVQLRSQHEFHSRIGKSDSTNCPIWILFNEV